MAEYGSDDDQLTIITTCVNYDDFLSVTLPHMVNWGKAAGGRVVVVSDRHDFETGKVAAKHGAVVVARRGGLGGSGGSGGSD